MRINLHRKSGLSEDLQGFCLGPRLGLLLAGDNRTWRPLLFPEGWQPLPDAAIRVRESLKRFNPRLPCRQLVHPDPTVASLQASFGPPTEC